MAYWKPTYSYLQFMTHSSTFARQAVKAALRPKYQQYDLLHFKVAEFAPRGKLAGRKYVSNLGLPNIEAHPTAVSPPKTPSS